MTGLITPQPGILDITPYKVGASGATGVSNTVKLSSNENPLGPSPRAIAAYEAESKTLHRYPSGDHGALRSAIGEVYGLDPDHIVCGAGSDEIIALLCQAYAGPGDEVLFTEHGFAMYRISGLAAGATPVAVAEADRVADIDALLAACTERTRLVFIANPNNPTGTMVSLAAIERLAEGLPEQALLVIDGAYAEYIEGYDSGAALVARRENVVMTRTFSKIYGLGALRVGWCYAPSHVVDVLHRVRGPFNVSSAGLAAAEAAVRDIAYIQHCRAENARWRTWLAKALAEVGVPSDTSSGNFILARFNDADEAEACNAALDAAGLIVRPVAGYGLPNALRITVGDEAACRAVAETVAEFKAARR